MSKNNIHKKETFEDKFARKFYCENARINQLRLDKKRQSKQNRKNGKKYIKKYL